MKVAKAFMQLDDSGPRRDGGDKTNNTMDLLGCKAITIFLTDLCIHIGSNLPLMTRDLLMLSR